MELLIGLAYFLLFCFVINNWKFFDIDGIHKAFLPVVFTLKVIAGIGLTVIYSSYYQDRNTADIFKYYDDSLIIYNAAFSNFTDFLQLMSGIGNDNAYFDKQYYRHMNHWLRPFGNNYYNDTHILIRFNAFMRFLSFGYFSVHTLFFNFLSLLGLVAFFRAFKDAKAVNQKILLYGICLLPSILLWGSGVLKEGMLFLGMGLLFYASKKLKDGYKAFLPYVTLLLSAYLLLRLKFYILLALVPAAIAFLIIQKFEFKKVFAWHLVLLLLLLGLGMNLGIYFPQFDVLSIISKKQQEFICLAEFMNSGSVVSLPLLDGSPAQFLQAIPIGLFNSFFRPLPWEIHSILSALNALEIIFINGAILFALLFRKTNKDLNMNLIFFSISVVVVLYAIVGISTPVLGALVRYKVPALLFIILVASILVDNKKLGIFARYLNNNDE